MLERLGSYPRANGLALALREIGRVERTLFTLDWIERPEERRRATRELNKGEAQNALKSAIFFHRTGRIRDQGLQAQAHRASAPNLQPGGIADATVRTVWIEKRERADSVPPDRLVVRLPDAVDCRYDSTMTIKRRTFLAGTAALVAVGPAAAMSKEHIMYGLIGKMTAQAGKRSALTDILVKGVAGMPGCLSYVVADDPADANVIWITEVWESKEAHAASLQLPSVRDAITKGRPLIAGMERVAETSPVGGSGLTGGK